MCFYGESGVLFCQSESCLAATGGVGKVGVVINLR